MHALVGVGGPVDDCMVLNTNVFLSILSLCTFLPISFTFIQSIVAMATIPYLEPMKKNNFDLEKHAISGKDYQSLHI